MTQLPESRSCAALLVAAPASGQGKTTVACALARLHIRQGRRARAFKCGPDFLAPGWLALATGAPVHSLDLWMTGEVDCAARLHEAAKDADLLIVEGVMGLFDGSPSAADLAARFRLLVLAVVDASAMAGTFAALAFGLRHYRSDVRWAGVLANRVAGERHAGMLQQSLRDPQELTLDGKSHAMWGLLPGRVTMQRRLAALGPQQLVLGDQVLRGHTFHHSTCETPLPARARTCAPGQRAEPQKGEALYRQGTLQASYFHAWFSSNPQATARLFNPALLPVENSHG